MQRVRAICAIRFRQQVFNRTGKNDIGRIVMRSVAVSGQRTSCLHSCCQRHAIDFHFVCTRSSIHARKKIHAGLTAYMIWPLG